MKAVITGAAGFTGSHLARKLLARGWEITGIDAMTDYYARAEKEERLKDLFSFNRDGSPRIHSQVPGWQNQSRSKN